jgi:hypothetical protein
MGLTSWKGGVVRKGDFGTAKNYLSRDEIDELNRIVVMFLDFAEDNARRRKRRDWPNSRRPVARLSSDGRNRPPRCRKRRRLAGRESRRRA